MESGIDGAVYSRFITLDNDEEVEKSKRDEKGGNLEVSIKERRIWTPEIFALSKGSIDVEEVEVVDSARRGSEKELKKLDLKFVRKEIFEIGEDEDDRTSGQGKSEVLLGLAVEAMKSIEEDEMSGDRGILTA